MSLVARHLEANGIAAVIVGSARDIVTHVGVARFLFTDFPLGNPCGKPFERDMQRAIVTAALALLETASRPRTTVDAPFSWGADQTWRSGYMHVGADNRASLLAEGVARRRQQRLARAG